MRADPIPFGAERKDPLWRWGAWIVGVVVFLFLAWVATWGGVDLVLSWRSLLFLLLGGLLSARSGRALNEGQHVERHFTRVVQPTVDVQGQPGSTYVLLEPARGRRVKPRDLAPGWWALYSIAIRAPVAAGDVALTLFWRALRHVGFSSMTPRMRTVEAEQAERTFPEPPEEF